MAPRKPAALVVALALVFAACGGDDDGDAGPTTTEAPTEEAPVEGAGADGPGADLADDVAATVDGVEITTAGFDEQVEALADNPEIGAQLEGEQGDQIRELVRAEALTAAILTQVALAGAEELGRPVSEDDVAESRSELEAQAGGADALAEAIAGQGLTDASVDVQLRGLAALHNVEEALAEEAGDEAPTTTAAEADAGAGELSPEAQAAQDYLMERLAEAEIVVNDDYGTWDADAAQVVPPGGLPAPPGSAPGG